MTCMAITKKMLKGWQGYRLKSTIAEYNIHDEYD